MAVQLSEAMGTAAEASKAEGGQDDKSRHPGLRGGGESGQGGGAGI